MELVLEKRRLGGCKACDWYSTLRWPVCRAPFDIKGVNGPSGACHHFVPNNDYLLEFLDS